MLLNLATGDKVETYPLPLSGLKVLAGWRDRAIVGNATKTFEFDVAKGTFKKHPRTLSKKGWLSPTHYLALTKKACKVINIKNNETEQTLNFKKPVIKHWVVESRLFVQHTPKNITCYSLSTGKKEGVVTLPAALDLSTILEIGYTKNTCYLVTAKKTYPCKMGGEMLDI